MHRVVYSRHYNIGFYGLERLHPFDSRKYGRVWKQLRRHFGAALRRYHVRPTRPANREELLLVHTDAYLKQLRNSQYVAKALEVPAVRYLPWWAIDLHILRPMRWATRGTLVAAQEALEHGFAVNLSGGYHHAKPDRGEGFSIYADAGICVASLRQQNLISETARIVCIDTDAHLGNGVCHTFMHDDRVFLFDIFNCHIYPIFDVDARKRVDCHVGVTSTCTDKEYMHDLETWLPRFLDAVCNSPVGLAIYNAGTDVFAGDPLGGMNISAATIRDRDMFVVGELRKRNIPTIMVLSGGYTKQSYQLVADSVIGLLERET
ncbi:histone deacetylase family protein [Lignipirellula cremea]|uniref:Acetoin utilization protein AcuC n=1 Tax=Lignipirellula cremea TaxID=2528010 RepID=A0A518DR98_9BACT|nr:histone deacetylase [Lignipirellula cremea]QDU94370.1 Acetoin utilization protein AcuC [Lignipirellula cremea]